MACKCSASDRTSLDGSSFGAILPSAHSVRKRRHCSTAIFRLCVGNWRRLVDTVVEAHEQVELVVGRRTVSSRSGATSRCRPCPRSGTRQARRSCRSPTCAPSRCRRTPSPRYGAPSRICARTSACVSRRKSGKVGQIAPKLSSTHSASDGHAHARPCPDRFHTMALDDAQPGPLPGVRRGKPSATSTTRVPAPTNRRV
jgi:hypothetical protein